MRVAIFCFFLFCAQQAWTQAVEKQFPKSFKVKVSNALNKPRENSLMVLTADQLKKIKGFNTKAFVVMDGNTEVASQYNESEKVVVFVINRLAANESRELIVRYHPSASIKREYKKLTQAELSYKTGGEWKNREYIGGTFQNTNYLRVPKEHKDHSWFIRYEGPGWESDKVGYRFYLDQRNATDVFGKKVTEPVLQLAGQDGFDSYHNMQPWGMDVMKVGSSLGVGSIGAIVKGKAIRVEKTDSVTCRITENGNVYSSIQTRYLGWQVKDTKHDVQSDMSIHAGTRLTHQVLTISNNADSICTGIVKDSNAKVFKSKGDATQWGYLATYGKQSLNNNDELGLVVFFNPASAIDFTEDKYSHIIMLKPNAGKLDYYFAGAWVLEPNGIKNETEFLNYIKRTAEELSKPITIH